MEDIMRFFRFILLVVITLLFSSCNLIKYEWKLKNTTIEDIDISKVKDGKYRGYYDLYLVNAEVTVKIKSGKIEKLVLAQHKHSDGYGAKSITETILEKQTISVDAVSGATGSSIAIKKAVELALRGGIDNE